MWGRLFTTGEIQTLLRVTQRQLAYWDRSDLVSPSGRSAAGPGSRRLYTPGDLLRLRVIVRLRLAGLPLQRIRQALRELERYGDEPAPLAELDILTDGRRILIRRSDEQLLDPVARQLVLCCSLAELLPAEAGATSAGLAD